MNVIRMIKLFGWEPRVGKQLAEKREEELELVKKSKLLELINNNLTHAIPLVTMIVTYATYVSSVVVHEMWTISIDLGFQTMIMKRDLTGKAIASLLHASLIASHSVCRFLIYHGCVW